MEHRKVGPSLALMPPLPPMPLASVCLVWDSLTSRLRRNKHRQRGGLVGCYRRCDVR